MVASFGKTNERFSSLVEVLHHRSLTQGGDLAYQFLGDGEQVSQTLTYRQLHQQAQAGAAFLRHFLTPGDRVLLLFPAGNDFLVAFFSCLYAGVIAVPMNAPGHPRAVPKCLAVMQNAETRWVMTNRATQSRIQPLLEESGQRDRIAWLILEDIPSPQESQSWLSGETPPEIAFLQYTSGSTGDPKGVMVSHRNLVYNIGLIAGAKTRLPQDHIVCWLPAFHDWGLIGFLLHGLYAGVPCTFMDPLVFLLKPIRWLQAISRYRATFSGAPNFAYDLCLKTISPEQRAGLDLSTWEAALVGAEPIRYQTLVRFSQTFADCGFRREAFLPCYGLAESTLWVSGCPVESAPKALAVAQSSLLENRVEPVVEGSDASSLTLVSSGLAVGDHHILIVDPEQRVPCAAPTVGEVWVTGASVARGYWGDPDLSKATFQAYLANGAGPFLRTGDLGFLQNGELYITGRLKDLIIIAGRNYYPQDIELAIEGSHPDLRPGHGAAFAIDRHHQEQLVIVQELRPGRRPPLDQVIGSIQKAVATTHGIMASAILLLKPGTVPKTSSGKIMRFACKRRYLTNGFESIAAWEGKMPGQDSCGQFAPENSGYSTANPGAGSDRKRPHI